MTWRLLATNYSRNSVAVSFRPLLKHSSLITKPEDSLSWSQQYNGKTYRETGESKKQYSVPIYLKSIVIPSKSQLNLANNRDVQQMNTENTAHRMKTNKS
jgi:hypothetical protein